MKKTPPPEFRQKIVCDFVDCLLKYKIKLVCFDFDETITVNAKRFVSKTFQYLFATLKDKGIFMAVTTFNVGYDIKSLLQRKLVPLDNVFFPIIRRASRLDFVFGKLWHILQAMELFGIPKTDAKQVLLIDDLENNVKSARQFDICALEVQRRKGLSSEDLLRSLANPNFYFSPQENSCFVPSLNKFPKQELQERFELILDPCAMDPTKRSIYLLLQKDGYGNYFLLAVCFEMHTMKIEFPFMVVQTKMRNFLEALLKQRQEKKERENENSAKRGMHFACPFRAGGIGDPVILQPWI